MTCHFGNPSVHQLFITVMHSLYYVVNIVNYAPPPPPPPDILHMGGGGGSLGYPDPRDWVYTRIWVPETGGGGGGGGSHGLNN